ncbi:MAG: hypothetical protein JWR67_1645 [Mucilaginibacter sp.]|nr:hypothetical protein [Mucilaginibacter sp.]
MLFPSFQKPVTTRLNLMVDKWLLTNENKLLRNAPVWSIHIGGDSEKIIHIENKLFVSKIFTLTFLYLGEMYDTKVMKVKYYAKEAMYKVALSSKLSNVSNICWLQRQQQRWVLKLGRDIDQRLINAITSALDSQNLALI